MVFQWRDFRVAYPDIHRLRALVPYDTPWFGCTATLNKEAEEFVVRKAGFRRIGNFTGALRLIRTSVDRPDISIIVQPLEKGATRHDYRRLEFLFHGLKKDAPESIDKTIVYIDSKAQLHRARNHLVKYIRNLGYSTRQASLIIRRYDADTCPDDQKRLYDDFRGPRSECRVILATVSLGMGMDIPDVMRVVQYGQLLSRDLADLWQRFGRTVRDGRQQGKAYFFPPYWYFDLLGTNTAAPKRPAHRKK
jgi:superfamily II DNA helicase RecQ